MNRLYVSSRCLSSVLVELPASIKISDGGAARVTCKDRFCPSYASIGQMLGTE